MMGSMVGRLLLYKVIGQSNTFAVAGYSRWSRMLWKVMGATSKLKVEAWISCYDPYPPSPYTNTAIVSSFKCKVNKNNNQNGFKMCQLECTS